jgi:cytochrome P450
MRVLSDHHEFSSEYGNLGLLHTDPPRHRKLRNLVTEAFTPRTVEALRPRITEIVDELLDQVTPLGRMDLIEDFAVPLPVKVIAELLGIPIEERERFKRWSDAVVTGGQAGMSDAQASREMGAFFTDLMEERRRSPREDLISALLAARIDGESLDQRELLSFCILLLVAGNETTTNLIGNAILCFDEHPDLEAQLRAGPELLASAIDEVLRYRSPIQSMFRKTRSEVRLGGQTIPAGEMVVAWIGSANRDPHQFPEPDRFDIRRSPNRHLAFGQGIHFCLGAPLARLEATIALRALLERLGPLQVDRAGLAPLASQVLYGVQRLPVAFTAGA